MYKMMVSCIIMLAIFLDVFGQNPDTGLPNPVVMIETNYGVIEVELFRDKAPLATENFIRLAEEGAYKTTPFHRIIPSFMIQGGDTTRHDGTGGRSIWNQPFMDEISNELCFDQPGKLAMANRGRDTNESQFFITTAPARWLDQKHTIFGQVVSGYDTVKAIEALGSSSGALKRIWDSWWSYSYPEKPVIIDMVVKIGL